MNLSIWFESFKRSLSFFSGLGEQALHIHIGLGLFAFLVLITKRKPITATIVVLLVALAGETLDYYRLISWGRAYPMAEGVADVLNTIAWPLLLTIYCYRQSLMGLFSTNKNTADLAKSSE